ncbi:xylan glycosyltransferase MUCI21-like [Aristolochia californica]|uniref:xylan glycosyltransferase MUCI21-like n=1 Tax=Aristolochia californica TaxID=171875 RepID=UPI0035D71BF1
MKRGVTATTVVCVSFFICFSIHQISVLWTSEHPPAIPSKIKENLLKQEPGDSSQKLLQKPALMHCDHSRYRYDLCHLNGPTVMYPTNSSFLVMGPTLLPTLPPRRIRPYPRKWESDIMADIKEVILSVTGSDTGASGDCQVYHDTPALVFSTGGYTGNFYHDFTDGFVPLFITIRTLFQQEEPVLVIANCHNWWLSRYVELLRGFTRRPVINLDNETAIHCFPSVKIGLIVHGDMSIDPALMPNSETFRDFHALVHRSYDSATTPRLSTAEPRQHPRLVVVSRTHTVGRVILNQADVIREAEEAGFDVEIFAPKTTTMLSEAYELINASHAMLGVHGAALTHMFFLRPGAVFIQVVALGLEWASDVCFGQPAPQFGLDYMEYKIKVEESTLAEKYSKDDLVLTNPRKVVKKGWNYTNLYLKDQDVRLDLVRIRSYLKMAYEKATKLVEKEQHGRP